MTPDRFLLATILIANLIAIWLLTREHKLPSELLKIAKAFPQGMSPPVGGHLFYVRNVVVQMDEAWDDAIGATSLLTAQRLSSANPGFYEQQLHRIGSFFPASQGLAIMNVLLVNLPRGMHSLNSGLEWAKQYGLRRMGARAMLGLVRDRPDLHSEIYRELESSGQAPKNMGWVSVIGTNTIYGLGLSGSPVFDPTDHALVITWYGDTLTVELCDAHASFRPDEITWLAFTT